MSLEHDDELVKRCQKGDTTAFEQLYVRYKNRVFATALRIVGRRADAEDVAQDTFVSALVNIRRFEHRSRFSTWLYRICVNTALNWRRSRAREEVQRRTRDETDEVSGASATTAGGADSAVRVVVERELEEAVEKALLRLSPAMRATVVLRYISGLSYKEVSDVLGCSIGTVKSRLNRAHKALLPVLKEMLEE